MIVASRSVMRNSNLETIGKAMSPGMVAKILVIEDDAAISDVVCSALSGVGYECTPAYSGSEARLLLSALKDQEEVQADEPLKASSEQMVESVGAVTTKSLDRSSGKLFAQASTSPFPFDLVICDLMLPGLSGEEIISAIRQTSAVPILVMSAKAEVNDRVTLLRQGVDDYLVKPFDLDELVARVEVLLRRAGLSQAVSLINQNNGGTKMAEGQAQGQGQVRTLNQTQAQSFDRDQSQVQGASNVDTVLTFGEWELSETRRTLEVNGNPVRLTRTEFDILVVLMHHPQKVFTKRELYEAAWHEEALVEEKAINTHISNIRSKLKETGTDTYIETVWGIGFKLTDLES